MMQEERIRGEEKECEEGRMIKEVLLAQGRKRVCECECVCVRERMMNAR